WLAVPVIRKSSETPRARAMSSRLWALTLRLPFSRSDRKLLEIPAFCANWSWVQSSSALRFLIRSPTPAITVRLDGHWKVVCFTGPVYPLSRSIATGKSVDILFSEHYDGQNYGPGSAGPSGWAPRTRGVLADPAAERPR